MEFIKKNWVKLLYIFGILFILITYFSIYKDISVDDYKDTNTISNVKVEYKMQIVINNKAFDVVLENNEVVNELKEKLPLTIKMKDLNSTEKYYYFKDKFSTNPVSIGKLVAGDIVLYGDNCLKIFYNDYETNEKYTRIGQITDIDLLKKTVDIEDVTVNIKMEAIYSETN